MRWLSVKRNFLSYFTLGVGGVAATIFTWRLQSTYDPPALVLVFAFAVCVGAGYVGGHIMWRLFKAQFQQFPWRDKSQ